MEIVYNGKVQRPGVCNALETIIVHQDVAKQFLPVVATRLVEAGVELRGDEQARAATDMNEASEADWDAEYLDLILAVKVVRDLDQAMAHIAQHGSLHTEVIVTANEKTAQKFLKEADASAVMWNASTRFNDGRQLGLGAEIGISTSKSHAFGPMGLEELTTTKFVVVGQGQVRE